MNTCFVVTRQQVEVARHPDHDAALNDMTERSFREFSQMTKQTDGLRWTVFDKAHAMAITRGIHPLVVYTIEAEAVPA